MWSSTHGRRTSCIINVFALYQTVLNQMLNFTWVLIITWYHPLKITFLFVQTPRTELWKGARNGHLIRFSNFSLSFERDIGCAQLPAVSSDVGKRYQIITLQACSQEEKVISHSIKTLFYIYISKRKSKGSIES